MKVNNVSNQNENTCHHKSQTHTQGKCQVYNAHSWVEIDIVKAKHSTNDANFDFATRLRQTQ